MKKLQNSKKQQKKGNRNIHDDLTMGPCEVQSQRNYTLVLIPQLKPDSSRAAKIVSKTSDAMVH